MYYNTDIRIDDFNPIEKFKKFLTDFKIKEKHFGMSYETKFVQVGNELLDKVKIELKKRDLHYRLKKRMQGVGIPNA